MSPASEPGRLGNGAVKPFPPKTVQQTTRKPPANHQVNSRPGSRCVSTEKASSLDPLETTAESLRVQTGIQYRLHAPFARERNAIVTALERSDKHQVCCRASKMSSCSSQAMWAIDEEDHPVFVLNRCKDRLCPLCAKHRSWTIAERIERLLSSFNEPRMMTLTIQHRAENLESNIRRLATSFRKLRETPNWKQRVKGGVYVIEVTRNIATGTWHPHLHILFDGTFYPQSQLADEWQAITGDSRIVWLNRVGNKRNSARYAAKYAAKPTGMETWEWEAVCEYAEAMHGKRMTHTFGHCHGRQVDPTEKDTRPPLSADRLFSSDWRQWFATDSPKAQLLLSVAPLISNEVARAFDVKPIPPEQRKTPNAQRMVRTFVQLLRDEFEHRGQPPPNPGNVDGGNDSTVQTQRGFAWHGSNTRRNAQQHGM